MKRELAARAAETVVLASREKRNAASAFVTGEATLAQTIVIERTTDAALAQGLAATGVNVVRA